MSNKRRLDGMESSILGKNTLKKEEKNNGQRKLAAEDRPITAVTNPVTATTQEGSTYGGYLSGEQQQPTNTMPSVTVTENFNTVSPYLEESTGSETEKPATGSIAETYEAWLENMNKTKQSAYEQALRDYDKAVVESDRRYAKNRADGGAMSEQLYESGLANSGYANYLNDRAYAVRSSEILAAQAAKAEAERVADQKYDDAYYQYLLTQAENQAQTKTALAEKLEVSSGAESLAELNRILDTGALTREQLASEYERVLNDEAAKIDTQTVFIDPYTNTRMTKANAEKYVSDLEKAGMSGEYVSRARALIESQYRVSSNANAYVDTSDFREDGEKIKVHIDGNSMVLNKGEETSREDVKEAALEASKDSRYDIVFFKYDGELYAYDKSTKKAYTLSARSGRDGYNDLLNALSK